MLIEVVPLFYSRAEVKALTGLGDWALKGAIDRGEFPAPRRVSARRLGFPREEVHRWLESLPVALQGLPESSPPSECSTAGEPPELKA